MSSDSSADDYRSLVEGFWAEESTPHVRRLLLDEVAGKRSGATRFDFNMYGVVLDFDAWTATVEDILQADEAGTETVDLASFLSTAEAYGDDPSLGDGLTESERRPPTFKSSSEGTVERISGEEDERH